MAERNPAFTRIQPAYFSHEVHARKEKFLKQHPEAKIISLGVGDTTEPFPLSIAEAMGHAAKRLSTREGYQGYGPPQGSAELRQKIAARMYQDKIHPEEIFISDGAKSDLARWQLLFGSGASIAVQDPSYPVYAEGSILLGSENILYLPCKAENEFFPDFVKAPKADLIYVCSPNNPTGTVATRKQLEELVAYAKKTGAIILFDSAYVGYIQDPLLPKTIYEIPGAKEVAIEVGSFSKLAGFSGVRLGWSVVPQELHYVQGGSVKEDWIRLQSLLFNGASHISEAGGIQVLSETGWREVKTQVNFYLVNALLLKDALEKRGYTVYGGEHAPCVWVHQKGKRRWDLFQDFLEQFQLVGVPGFFFGKGGEEYLRLTSFNSREKILEAVSRIIPHHA